jgi:hypothetical protein
MNIINLIPIGICILVLAAILFRVFIRRREQQYQKPVKDSSTGFFQEDGERIIRGKRRAERIAHMLGVLQGYPPPPENDPPTEFMEDVYIVHRRCVIVVENDYTGDDYWSDNLKDAVRKALDKPDFSSGEAGKTYDIDDNKITVYYTSHITEMKIPEKLFQMAKRGKLK